jgi:nucleotide-binding universal stress UspA family protein
MTTAQLTPIGVGIHNVLIATDLSGFSNSAVNFGLRLASSCHARAFVVSVLPVDQFLMAGPEVYVAAKDAARRDMEELEADLRRAHSCALEEECRFYLLEGDVARAILEFAQEKEVDLVVVGTHGRGGLQKALLGSVAERIFRSSPVPVLTLGPGTCGSSFRTEPREILVAADFTPPSRRAVQYALRLAHERNSKLTLLHVVDPRQLRHVPDSAAAMQGMKIRLTELLGGEAEDVPCSIRVVVGQITETILLMAGERHADLIVLGVRPSSGMLDRLRIPHAYEVICAAPCPVLTLRETKIDCN